MASKCKRDLFAICRVKKCMPRHVLIKTIESTVLPRLFYASSVIHAAPKTYIENSLVRVVNFGAKLVFGLRKFDRASVSRKELGWLDAHSELSKRSAIMAYKSFKTPEFLDLHQPISLSTNRVSQRLNNVVKLSVPSFRTDVAKRSFSYRAPTLLNYLCSRMNIDLNNSPTISKFKILLKQFYMTN